jgi:hypothetical protein
MSTLKAVLGSMLAAAAAWWFLTSFIREMAATP